MNTARHSHVIAAIVLLLGTIVVAQTGSARPAEQRQASVAQTVVSPEVLPDRRVTFRIYAPRASEVLLRSGWSLGERVKMEKDEQGIWSVTVGPLPAGYYNYLFFVDDVPVTDRKSPDGSLLYAAVFVPGPDAEFMANKPVPHGEIRQVWYESTTFGRQRRMHVYTPPGYEGGATRYPVLYVLHGGGDNDSSWMTFGRAGFILDNLLAAKKATPMVLVTPDVPWPPDRAKFTEDLIKDIVPYVEKTYRIRPNRDSRALAGQSVGGYETLKVLTSHSGDFAHFAVWSAPVEPKGVAQFAQEQALFLSNAAAVNQRVKSLWFRMGSEDMGVPHVRALSGILTSHGIRHDLTITSGAHDQHTWRKYLLEFAQAIFR